MNTVEGDTEVREIAVLALFTTWSKTPEVLAMKFRSPL